MAHDIAVREDPVTLCGRATTRGCQLMPQDDQRVVRVFVSSTFQDMFREWEILVKRIFPQLREPYSGRRCGMDTGA